MKKSEFGLVAAAAEDIPSDSMKRKRGFEIQEQENDEDDEDDVDDDDVEDDEEEEEEEEEERSEEDMIIRDGRVKDITNEDMILQMQGIEGQMKKNLKKNMIMRMRGIEGQEPDRSVEDPQNDTLLERVDFQENESFAEDIEKVSIALKLVDCPEKEMLEEHSQKDTIVLKRIDRDDSSEEDNRPRRVVVKKARKVGESGESKDPKYVLTTDVLEIGDARFCRVYRRPPISYADLITYAIAQSDEQKLKLNSIYCFLTRTFGYFKHHTARRGWENSIRHNLSMKSKGRFLKIKENDDSEKGSFWYLNTEKTQFNLAMENARETSDKLESWVGIVYYQMRPEELVSSESLLFSEEDKYYADNLFIFDRSGNAVKFISHDWDSFSRKKLTSCPQSRENMPLPPPPYKNLIASTSQEDAHLGSRRSSQPKVVKLPSVRKSRRGLIPAGSAPTTAVTLRSPHHFRRTDSNSATLGDDDVAEVTGGEELRFGGLAMAYPSYMDDADDHTPSFSPHFRRHHSNGTASSSMSSSVAAAASTATANANWDSDGDMEVWVPPSSRFPRHQSEQLTTTDGEDEHDDESSLSSSTYMNTTANAAADTTSVKEIMYQRMEALARASLFQEPDEEHIELHSSPSLLFDAYHTGDRFAVPIINVSTLDLDRLIADPSVPIDSVNFPWSIFG